MKAYNKQRELFKETRKLRDMDLSNVDFEIAQGIREEDRKYKQWLFYKKLRKEMEKGKENEQKTGNC